MVEPFRHVYKLQVEGVSPQCGIKQIRAGGIGLIGLFPKRTIPYEARVRFGTRVQVRVVRNLAIFEKGGCRYGGTRRLKNY